MRVMRYIFRALVVVSVVRGLLCPFFGGRLQCAGPIEREKETPNGTCVSFLLCSCIDICEFSMCASIVRTITVRQLLFNAPLAKSNKH